MEARARRNEAGKEVTFARQLLDEAEARYQRLDQTVATLEELAKEQDDFRDSAGALLD